MVSATGTTNLGIEMLLAPTNQGTVGFREKKDGARSLVRDLPKCFELRLVNECKWYCISFLKVELGLGASYSKLVTTRKTCEEMVLWPIPRKWHDFSEWQFISCLAAQVFWLGSGCAVSLSAPVGSGMYNYGSISSCVPVFGIDRLVNLMDLSLSIRIRISLLSRDKVGNSCQLYRNELGIKSWKNDVIL